MSVTLHTIESPADAVAATGALIAAGAKAQIAPSETQTIAAVIDAHRRIVELEDHKRRLKVLEKSG